MQEKKRQQEREEARPPGRVYTEDDLKRALRDIAHLEKERTAEERKYRQLNQEYDAKIRRVKHETNVLYVRMKEKDQENRILNLKIQECRRLTGPTRNRARDALNSKEQDRGSTSSGRAASQVENRSYLANVGQSSKKRAPVS